MQNVTASEVRTWAAAKGLAKADARGRLPKAAIEAFNAAHRSKSFEAGFKPEPTLSVEVKVPDAKGRPRTKTVQVEASALRVGIGAGKRGPVNREKAAEFVIGQGLA